MRHSLSSRYFTSTKKPHVISILNHICFCFAISVSCCQQSPGTIFTSTTATSSPTVDIEPKSPGLAASAFACCTVSPVYPVVVTRTCAISLFFRTVPFGHGFVGTNECASWVAGSQGWRSSFFCPSPLPPCLFSHGAPMNSQFLSQTVL